MFRIQARGDEGAYGVAHKGKPTIDLGPPNDPSAQLNEAEAHWFGDKSGHVSLSSLLTTLHKLGLKKRPSTTATTLSQFREWLDSQLILCVSFSKRIRGKERDIATAVRVVGAVVAGKETMTRGNEIGGTEVVASYLSYPALEAGIEHRMHHVVDFDDIMNGWLSIAAPGEVPGGKVAPPFPLPPRVLNGLALLAPVQLVGHIEFK